MAPPRPNAPQRIPRPPAAEPGSPAPWAAAVPTARHGISITRVREAIVQRTGPVEAWPAPASSISTRPAAVLVALFEEDGEARVILTRRASHLRNHQGEVAFPGGRVEEGETLVDAALREAFEEIALDPAEVEVIGELAPLSTMVSAAAITPFVGVLPRRPQLQANPAEVEHIFDVALADLIAPDVFEEEVWVMPERGRRPMFFFHLDHDTIWGATARMLYELLALVAAP